MITNNAVLGGITIHTTNVSENITKDVRLIKIPTNQDLAKNTKLLDLFKMEKRITIDGFIEYTDKAAMKLLITNNRIITLVWDGETRNVIMDKLDISMPSDEQTEIAVKITCVEGESVFGEA